MFRKPDIGNGQTGSRELASQALFGGAFALVIAVFAWMAQPGFLESSPDDAYYNLLVQGFQSGHLNVNRWPAPGLAKLANPYDPVANAPLVWNEPYLSYDMSYYRGKLYLYFGVTPAVVLFWPYAILTGHYLSQTAAVVIFCGLGLLLAAGMVHQAWRRYFPEVNVWVATSGVIVLGFATGLIELLSTCDVYEVAISCAFAFVMLALAAIWCAMHGRARKVQWLLLASLAYGLAVGARPSLLFGSVILLLPVVQAWRETDGPGAIGRRILLFGAAIGPLVCIGFGLMLYNQMRFGSPFEFGWHYQLTDFHNKTSQPFSVRYVWFNFRFYFLEPMRWTRQFPFLQALRLGSAPPGYAGVGTDPYGGVLCNCPILWLAAAALAWSVRTRSSALRWWMAALFLLFAVCAFTVCLFLTASSRYQLDFLPALMLAAVVGIFCLEQALAGSPFWRRLVRVGWVLLLVYSAAFNLLAGFGARVTDDYFVGNRFLNCGSVDEAIARFHSALRLDPDSAEAHSGLGNALLKKGDLPGAVIQFEQALKIKPDFGEIHNNLGFCFLRLGRVDDAILQYQTAVQCEPESAIFRNALGNALAGAGRLDEAIGEYQKVVEMDPSFADTHYNLGYCLFEKGLFAGAIAQYDKAVALEPGSADFHNGLGNALVRAGRMDEAIAQYQKAVELNPKFAEAHYNLGYLFFQKGMMDQSVGEFKQAISLQPDLVQADESLGDAYLKEGLPLEAIAQFRKAIAREPQFLPAKLRLAWTLATWPAPSVRNGPVAVALMEKADRLQGDKNPRILRTLAAAYAEVGRFEDAMATAKKALALAKAQSNPALAGELESEIRLYQTDSPYRTTNGP